MRSNELGLTASSLTGRSEPRNRPVGSPRGLVGLFSVTRHENLLCFYTTIINSGSGRGVVIGNDGTPSWVKSPVCTST